MLSERFTQALDYAREAHASQTRKGTSIPYLAHLLGVASLVLDHGGDQEQAIAALLHDAVEDQGAHHEALIRNQFGDRVAHIVMGCTDGTQESKAAAATPEEKRADWERRKRAYLAHLAHANDDVLLVSGCDKLHNARAIVADLRDPAIGAAVFERFTSGRDGTLWYYREIARVFAERDSPLAVALSLVVAKMARASNPEEASGNQARTISRDEARKIVEREIESRGLDKVVCDVLLLEELGNHRLPNLYSLDFDEEQSSDLIAECWIAYVHGEPVVRLDASEIVLVDRISSAVRYVGSANDEG